ncbi:MAG TPA: VWA domain-containing protein [Pyrinomonadaceae bacterium]|nr:VWA domain-containing protein [Pyrinomonadaceae bacterium]
MTRLLGILVLTIVLSCAALSQSPTPLPADTGAVVKISTNLIQIDVTVKDRKGKVVTDLRPEEIEIFENGKKQELTNFSFIANIRPEEQVEKPKEKDKSKFVLPSSALKPEQVRRTLALVVDDLSLSFESTAYAKRALKKFVDEQMQDGDLIAIIQTGAGTGALQQFTNDKRRLYAAIDRIRWNAIGSGGLGALEPLQEPMPGPPPKSPDDRTAADERREVAEYRNSIFANGTLGALEYVVRGMRELPGRKSILLLSDGIRMFKTENGLVTISNSIMDSMRQLADLATRASVLIHTMDARGLYYFGLTAADDPGGRTPRQLEADLKMRKSQFEGEQEGLILLAKKTGGTAIYNTNDLAGGIRKILDDQSYYLIGYQPDAEAFDPKAVRFNQLEVKVKRPGLQVSHRNGFIGVTDKELDKPRETPEARMFHSLSSPFAVNDISLRLHALFYKPPNFLDTFVRSFVHIPGRDLTFTDEPNGEKKAVFDIIAAGFGDTGTYVDRVSKTYTIVLTKEAYDRAMNQGLVYEFSFPVKTAGAYQFRISLRDHGNDKIGSAHQFIEVPNLKKGRMVLSGVVLDNIPYGEYQRQLAGEPAEPALSDPLLATSLRKFRTGTVLSYGFNVYNAKIVGASPNLTFQTRIFRDGKPIFEGPPEPVVPISVQQGTVAFSGSLALGTAMVAGEYVLQIVITDNGAKSKRNTATQFVLFDVVD